jgi:hypothetical protein
MEGFGYCILGVICVLVLLFIALFMSAILVGTGGLAGLLVSRGRGYSGKISAGLVVVGIIAILCLSGGALLTVRSVVRPSYSVDDEILRPYLSALEKVDRASLGFTPISVNDRIEIEYAVGAPGYDVMLHTYAETSRTIAFRKTADGSYEWIGEQEIFTGPHRYETVDGVFNEQIVITYDKVSISGAPVNQVYITYNGDDPRFTGKSLLTLQEVRPILEEWRNIRATPAP